MNCPVCKEPMIVLELDEVEIDYCTSCEGIWLDRGELEILLKSSSASDDLLNSFQRDEAATEKARRCPICDKRMEKALYEGKGRIRLDRCRRDHGIWLDKGELRDVLEEASHGTSGKVLGLLQDVFAKKPQ